MILGVDVGGTRVKAGLVREGRVLARWVARRPETPENLARKIRDWVGSRWEEVRAVGMGLAGLVSEGRVVRAPNLPTSWWIGVREWEALLGKPVRVDNDVNVMLRGERVSGVARDARRVVLIALGTGVGGAIGWDREEVHGAHGLAGEVGHMFLGADLGPVCRCGNRGCVEAYLGGWAVERWIRIHRDQGVLPPEVRTPKDLARMSHPRVDAFWKEYGRWLGYAVVNVAHLLDPEVVVVAGGLSGAWERFVGGLRAVVDEVLLARDVRTAFRVVRGALGEEAGVVGAAYLWLGQDTEAGGSG